MGCESHKTYFSEKMKKVQKEGRKGRETKNYSIK